MKKTRQKIFEEVKQEAEKEYSSIGKVFCPYLNKEVLFNIKGLKHIKFHQWKKARTQSDQFLRLKFLKLAPKIIKKSHTLQEEQQRKCVEVVRRNNKSVKIATEVKFYGFIAILRGVRVKIIVKDLLEYGGMPYFWSVIPFWKIKDDPVTGHLKKIFSEGNLETQ